MVSKIALKRTTFDRRVCSRIFSSINRLNTFRTFSWKGCRFIMAIHDLFVLMFRYLCFENTGDNMYTFNRK